jgi:hypothetical protein
MRSYEAARGLFTLIAGVAWLMIIGGVILVFVGLEGANDRGRYVSEIALIMAAAPGVAVTLVGALTLAMTQMGRATVDTAEYSQQMLQLSRENLEVSRQSLRQSEQIRTGFEALRMTQTDRPMADYGKGLDQAKAATGGNPAPALPAVSYGDKMGATPVGAAAKLSSIEAGLPGVSVAGYCPKVTSDKAT